MFELFKIGFLSITLVDVLDITLVTFIFYGLYRALKDTIAVQILFGLVILIGLKFITEAINLKSINWILNSILEIWLLAFIILFQPELRKLLLLITKSRLFQLFVRNRIPGTIYDVIEAVEELAEKRTGALIVFPNSQNVQMTIDTGIPLQAVVTKELIMSIFSTKSPLHDGAIVIENQTILAARCVLPLSGEVKLNNRNLGTRHRAALGLTEQVDAVVIVVSEETGWISLADGGQLMSKLSIEKLQSELKARLFDNNR